MSWFQYLPNESDLNPLPDKRFECQETFCSFFCYLVGMSNQIGNNCSIVEFY